MSHPNEIRAIEVTRISQIVRRELASVSAAGSQPESNYTVVSVPTNSGHTFYGEDATGISALADKMDKFLPLVTAVDYDIIGPLYYDEHFTSSPIQFRNGCALLSDRPGLGVDFRSIT